MSGHVIVLEYITSLKGIILYQSFEKSALENISASDFSRGSATEHVLYLKCHRKYYNGSASENIFSVALPYYGISIYIFSKAPALECIFYDT